MKPLDIFTYLSEVFAGHTVSTFASGSDLPEKSDKTAPEEDKVPLEQDLGGFMSQDMLVRRGASDHNFLA